ncbi:MAG: ATP-binding protein [Anaerolineae bacterium]
MALSIDHQAPHSRTFHITVLGRTLEHLGVQMYKRRDIAIAELVANSWDAGATQVDIAVPGADHYQPEASEISITDNGTGMDDDQVENEYLVVGRNRRTEDPSRRKRPVMGRKGIGKLAGFGLASEMMVLTWKGDVCTQLTLNAKLLQTNPGTTKRLQIPGKVGPRPDGTSSSHGTKIILRSLKHKTAPDIVGLNDALARRFSRRVRGEMDICVNGQVISDPFLPLEGRFPENGFDEEKLPGGQTIKYYFGFAKSNIQSKELQGFTIYVRGKTAQAPPFFFFVEATASGLHWARYMTGEIEADFLDESADNESDVISTDRQEIDWADEGSQELLAWGQKLTRKALRDWADHRGIELEKHAMEIPGIKDRVILLDPPSQRQVSHFLKRLGQAEPDPDRVTDLADALVRAYEYRHFHDVIEEIDTASEDPQQLALLLQHLSEWKVLESRAILEVIKGRLDVTEKFHTMLANNAPETASAQELDNLHDLLAGQAWILNPEWQVLAEEKKISTQLRQWHAKEVKDGDDRLRYDFLALSDDNRLVIIEIKRSGHAVELDELQRLEQYTERLAVSSDKVLRWVLICSGRFNLTAQKLEVWKNREDGEIREWGEIYERTHRYYAHYRAVLEGDIQHRDFANKEREVAQTRKILQPGATHRDATARKKGIGPQDRNDEV